MSFQETILPNFLIADLYKNVLIENDEQSSATTAKALQIKDDSNNAISFLGDNKKNIAIIIKDAEAVFIDEEKLQLLTNLLNACRLNVADVAIVNINNNNIVYNQVKQELQPSFLLLMGIDAKIFQLPIIFPEYRMQEYDNCQMLLATDLSNLLGTSEEVKLAKSKLWLCLKQMFLM